MSQPKYIGEECAVFSKTRARYGAYSNMAAGFPITANGRTFQTAEALYQCFRFPHRPDIQEKIVDAASPMTAKMISRADTRETRPGWMGVRLQIMRWCVTLKLLSHREAFGRELAKSGSLDIVELSRRDAYWGAIERPPNSGILNGENNLGLILMQLRSDFIHDELELPLLPDDQCLLFGEPPTDLDASCGGQARLFDV